MSIETQGLTPDEVLKLAKLRQKLDRDAAEANPGWSGDEVIAAYLDHRNEEQVEAFHDR